MPNWKFTDRKEAVRIDQALTRVVLDMDFFARLTCNLRIVEDKTRPTFCTDGERMWYNPEFCGTLSIEEVVGVLCHEGLHCGMGHMWRRGERDLNLWNIACDHEINNLLQEWLDSLKSKGKTVMPFALPKDAVCSPRFKGMACEKIYATLEQERQQQQQQDKNNQKQQQQQDQQDGGGGGEGQGDSDDDGNNDGDGDGQGDGDGDQDSQGQSQGNGQGQGKAGMGDFIDPQCQNEAENAERQTLWNMELESALKSAKDQGFMPGNMERAINSIVNPPVPFEDFLRRFLTRTSKDDYSFSNPNVRYAHTGFVFPSLKSNNVGRIAVAIDTSGSVSAEEVNHFVSLVNSVVQDVKPSVLTVIYCDSRVAAIQQFNPGDPIEARPLGGGGTDFTPVFDMLESGEVPEGVETFGCDIDLTEKHEALIYITDLYGSFPDAEPDYPVLWAVSKNGDSSTPPFGERCDLEA